MIELKYTFSTPEELLAHIQRMATTTVVAPVGKADTKPKATSTVSAAEKAVVLTSTQMSAVDETAGLGNAAKAASTPPTAEAAKADAQPPKVETSVPAVEYPVLQKAVFDLAGLKLPDEADPKDTIGRRAVVAITGHFGVKTFKDLEPSRYAQALEAVQLKTVEVKKQMAELEVA